MDNTIAMQLYSLLVFTISGIAIGIFFDIFRIMRRTFKTPDIITYIEDIIFWIFTGIFFLFVLFKFNNGEIRSYVIIGLLLGVLIYMLTISKYFIKINVFIISLIKKVILYPINLIWNILKKILKPFSFIVINIRKEFKKICRKMFNIAKKVKKIEKIAYGKKDFKNKCRKI